jgi:hypothetical protein
MSALTAQDLAYLQSELGTDVDQADLQARYDRLGSVVAVAAEVVKQRLATLIASPSSFTLPGVYSESNDSNIRALQQQQARLDGTRVEELLVAAGPAPTKLVRTDRVR